MAKAVKCIECGYLFGFSHLGVDIDDAEFDPDVLRRLNADQLDQVDLQDQITRRNYRLKVSGKWGYPVDNPPPERTVVRRYEWYDCDYIGCYRHQFDDISVMRQVENRWEINAPELANIIHIERDCDFFYPYQTGLSTREHQEVERQLTAEQEKAQIQWTVQHRDMFARYLQKMRQAETNDEKKKSLEYLAEFLFGSVPGLKVVDIDLRSSAEEIDLLVRNESDAAFWRNLGTPILVECKNWAIPVGAKEIRDLKGKMNTKGVTTAFLIAKSGVTGDQYRDARLLIREALGDRQYIIVLDNLDLQEIANGALPLEKFRDRYDDLFRDYDT